MDNKDCSKGISVVDLAAYIIRHLMGFIIILILVSAASGSFLYYTNYASEARREAKLKEQTESAEDVDSSTSQELAPPRSPAVIVLLSVGFGFVAAFAACLVSCVFSKKLQSKGIFTDRYGIRPILWGKRGAGRRCMPDDEVAKYIRLEVEDTDVRSIFVTGTVFDDADKALADMIGDSVRDIGITVEAEHMDAYSADSVRYIRRADIIIVIEHVMGSYLDDMDDEMHLISVNKNSSDIRVILRSA